MFTLLNISSCCCSCCFSGFSFTLIALFFSFLPQGLNFAIHADAAWGAYFSCMLRDPLASDTMPTPQEEGFVPELFLNNHVQKQLMVLKKCDTITVDPHKSGFCPYPAGAICYRNKNLNNFLSIASDVVYYHGDFTLGDVGIEGSKPGAAACGVLLANKVSKPDKNSNSRSWSRLTTDSRTFLSTLVLEFSYESCACDDDVNFRVLSTRLTAYLIYILIPASKPGGASFI